MKQEFRNHAMQVKDCAACGARYLMAKVKTLEPWEFGLFQLGLVSLGAWLATAFAGKMKKWKHIFFITCLASWAYVIWRIFGDTED